MSDVNKVYQIGDIALYRVLSELDLSDKAVAFILGRYMDEVSFGVSSYDKEDLELMSFRILRKLSKHSEQFKGIIECFYSDMKEDEIILDEIKNIKI